VLDAAAPLEDAERLPGGSEPLQRLGMAVVVEDDVDGRRDLHGAFEGLAHRVRPGLPERLTARRRGRVTPHACCRPPSGTPSRAPCQRRTGRAPGIPALRPPWSPP